MTLEDRVAALEQAVAALAHAPTRAPSATPDPEQFWALEGVQQRHPDGAVVYAGSLEVPGQGRVQWQFGNTADQLAEVDWSELAPVLDALGHPARLRLLQLVFSGVRTTAELAAQESLGSTGQIHHHLRILVAAGWLVHRSRGTYEVPARRVVPLLVSLLAARPE
ncbi:ArsR/SmtB family transcription factor [Mariniluteicoccus flavus]